MDQPLEKKQIKKIFITGATGHLGSYITKSLCEQGFEITIAIRNSSAFDKIEEIKNYVNSINIEEENWQSQLKKWGPDVVLHLATNYGRNKEPLDTLINSNLHFPIRILQCCLEMENKPVFINTDTSLKRDISPYALSKHQFLQWLKFFNKEMKIVNVVLENFYGIKDGQFVHKMTEQLKNDVDKIDFTLGIQRRDFVHYTDVIKAYEIILNKLNSLNDQFTNIEIGSGQSYSIKEVIEVISNLTGNKTTKLNWGALSFRENEVMDSNAKISKICSLGWVPKIDLVTGIKHLIDDV